MTEKQPPRCQHRDASGERCKQTVYKDSGALYFCHDHFSELLEEQNAKNIEKFGKEA
jgi:hypothetical protein